MQGGGGALRVLASNGKYLFGVYSGDHSTLTRLDPKTGLPVYLIDGRLEFLEGRMDEYIGRLAHPEINLKLTTQDGDKETLAILVEDGQPDRLDIRGYSGGQGSLMELSTKLAMADLFATTSPSFLGMLFLDEPEAGLDEVEKQALVELLHERARNGWPAVMIVTHDHTLSSAFNRRVEAEEGLEKETLLVQY